jgi:hypothetical protein
VEVVGDIESKVNNDLYLQATDLPRIPLSSKNPLLDKYIVKGVNRIEAPDITAEDPTARVPRYKLLTRFSASLKAGYSTVQSDVAAQNGLGSGIYIDNTREVQRENLRFSLTNNWMDPGSDYWSGNIYNPPGVRIELLSNAVTVSDVWVDGKKIPFGSPVTFPNGLIRITRSDRTWRVPDTSDPNNRDGRDTETFVQYFQYPLLPGENPPPGVDIRPTFSNGVIFAEGNVRVWGKLPKDRNNPCFPGGVGGQRLTIVSNATAYIEGSLLKGEPNGPGQPQRSGIAVLAKDYVAVNPTSYFAQVQNTNTGAWTRQTSGEFWAYTLSQPPDQYSMSVLNGVDAKASYPADSTSLFLPPPLNDQPSSDLPAANSVKQALYTQMVSESSTLGAGLRLQVNWNDSTPSSPRPYFHPWWEAVSPNRTSGHVIPSGEWSYEASPLLPFLEDNGRKWVFNSDGPNYLNFSVMGIQPVRIAKIGVAPLDVRIEAALYAMDGSFFVIPGEPFNGDRADTRASFAQAGGNQRNGGMRRYIEGFARRVNRTVQDVSHNLPYPFYGEPMDVKITVVGSVAENRPASPAAQTEWARLWGWTPLKKPSGAVMAHGGDGLSFQFDPQLRQALRYDKYNRPLPLMPRLPVSPDLIFSGEAQ